MDRSRLVAAAWVVGGVAWVTTGLLGLSAVDGTGGFYVTEVAWLVVHTLVLVGIVGLIRAGDTGDLRWGRAALQLAAVGRVLFLCFEVAAIVQGTDELAVFPLAVISTAVGMTVGGVAIINAGRWTGWGRFTPLAVGVYPFLAIFPVFAETGDRPPDALVAGWGLTLIGVGIALAKLSRRGVGAARPEMLPTPA